MVCDESFDIGLEPFPLRNGAPPIFQMGCPLSKDRSRRESEPAIDIGKSSCTSELPVEFESCGRSGRRATLSPADLEELRSMFGKTRLQLQEVGLNWERSPFKGTAEPIGTSSGSWPGKESWTMNVCRQTYTSAIIVPSVLLLGIVLHRLQVSEVLDSFGAQLDLAKADGLGKKPVHLLTVRTLGRSSGAGIEVRNILSLMSFEEVLMFPTFSDGSTDMLAVWKLREEVFHSP